MICRATVLGQLMVPQIGNKSASGILIVTVDGPAGSGVNGLVVLPKPDAVIAALPTVLVAVPVALHPQTELALPPPPPCTVINAVQDKQHH